MAPKYSISNLHATAKLRGGRCLSAKYAGANKKHLWECGMCNHRWKTTWSTINNQGAWCPKCAEIRTGKINQERSGINIEYIAQRAIENNCQLVSKTYKDSKSKIVLFCNKHKQKFSKSWSDLNQGQWCPKCGKERARSKLMHSVQYMHEIAWRFNGEFLGEKYLGTNKKHLWRCENGHEFYREPARLTKSNPLASVFCTQCVSTSHSEDFCRAVVETAFQCEFPNQFPFDWLRNSKGNKSQLDGYCESLNLAFEYQGAQHDYSFGRFDDDFVINRRKEDKLKAELCERNGIKLVTIPEFGSFSKHTTESLIQHVRKAFFNHAVAINAVEKKEVLNKYSELKVGIVQKLKQKAVERQIILELRIYRGMLAKEKLTCVKCNYKWRTSLSSVFNNGTGCPNCAGQVKKGIDFLKALAESHGGKCLSQEYTSVNSHYLWQCGACNHTWRAQAKNLQDRKVKGRNISGSWCPECWDKRRTKKGEHRLKTYISARRGQLVSEYKNLLTSVTIKCKRGHSWSVVPKGILARKSWCQKCKSHSSAQ